MQTTTVAAVGLALGGVLGYGIGLGADLRPLWLGAFVVSVAAATMAGALALHWGRILDEDEAVKPPR
jgi:hypothetical protein